MANNTNFALALGADAMRLFRGLQLQYLIINCLNALLKLMSRELNLSILNF